MTTRRKRIPTFIARVSAHLAQHPGIYLKTHRNLVFHRDVTPRSSSNTAFRAKINKDLASRVVRGLVTEREREGKGGFRVGRELDIFRFPTAHGDVVNGIEDLNMCREKKCDYVGGGRGGVENRIIRQVLRLRNTRGHTSALILLKSTVK